MSPFRLSRCLTAAVAIAAIGAALPAFADSAVTVTFQPNNPWTQEIGKVTRMDDAQDYTVAIEAGKTFQINLVTRDPNVFFTVNNDTQDKKLVDTYQTGATTWSTSNTDAATYTIHVYVQPEAMQRGEVADYALQIGQYGQSDMRAPTTTVTFEENKPWVQAVGTLDSQATSRDYAVAIAAGQTLAVNLVTRNPKVYFKVENPGNGQTLVDSATSTTTNWTLPVDAAANYTISVYADPAAVPPGAKAGYALQIGHYPQGNTQPATAGSAAAPPAAAASAAAPTAPAEAASAHH
ncbi:MAG TPA: hypothetical protein VJL61_03640 [Rhodanobacteraceae bacterium]|nr:hypothetical protein [Rhodanobacteraceae bacterium]